MVAFNGKDFQISQSLIMVGAYDCASIMHYGPTAFARPGAGKTLTPLGAGRAGIGTATTPSAGDVAAVDSLYRGQVGVPGSSVALGKHGTTSTDCLYIDVGGSLSVVWVVDTGVGNRGRTIGGPPAPAGAPVSITRQAPHIVTGAYTDNNGAPDRTRGQRQPVGPPLRRRRSGRTSRRRSVLKQNDEVLTVTFVDRDGFFSVAHVVGTGQWAPPFRVGGPGGEPGAVVAAARQTSEVFTAVFTDREGFMSVAHVVGNEQWKATVPCWWSRRAAWFRHRSGQAERHHDDRSVRRP